MYSITDYKDASFPMNSYAEMTNWIIVISDLFRISLWLFVSDRFFISLCD